MADWPNITDVAVDPDAPVTSNLMYGLRDAPIAIAEGAAGAPRNMLASLPRLVAGGSVRASIGDRAVNVGGGAATVSVFFGVIQFGTLRIVTTYSGGTASITRTRAGSTTTVATLGTSPDTENVDCIPGDLFSVSATELFSTGGGTLTITASLRTNGVDLWPAQGLWGNLTGNSDAP